jgi:adenylate cyclase
MDGETGSDQAASGVASAIPATLVLAPDRAGERSMPVYDWLVVGRECGGVDERHRLLIDDQAVSRTHLELRLDLELDQAWLTDHSTNGTRLNGHRIERSVPVRIKPGDRLRVGGAELQFRSRRFAAAPGSGVPGQVRDLKTIREISVTEMVMVVGDIIGFSTIAETTGDRVLLENIDRLYAGLRQILARHHGTLSNYVGDAFFATWEAAAPDSIVPDSTVPGGTVPGGAGAGGDAVDPARSAVAFTVEAAETVPRIAAGLDLRDPGGGPLRMGWGVALGPAAVSQLTGMLVTVLGDATNVAFRLSGLAGRDGRPGVLVTDAVYRATSPAFAFTPPSAIQVKGRSQPVEVLGASRL